MSFQREIFNKDAVEVEVRGILRLEAPIKGVDESFQFIEAVAFRKFHTIKVDHVEHPT